MEVIEIAEFAEKYLKNLPNEAKVEAVFKVYSGMLTEVYRVRWSKADINDATSDANISFIIKVVKNEVADSYDTVSGLHRELYFYNTILKDFNRILGQKKTSFLSYGNFCVPTLRHSSSDPEDLITLEDMHLAGFSNVTAPLDFNNCKIAIEALGKFHALSFALTNENPKLFASKFKHLIHPLYEQILLQDKIESLQSVFHKCIDNAIDALESYENFRIEKLNEFKDTIVKEVLDLTSPKEVLPHCVLLHGDFSLSNILFNKESHSICLIDFEHCGYGSCVLDLSNFIFTSIDTDLRNTHLADLIKLYYDSVALGIDKLGGNADEIFSWNTFQQQFKQFAAYGFIMALLQVESMFDEPIENSKNKDKPLLKHFNPTLEKTNAQKHIAHAVRDAIRLGYI